MLQIIRQRVTHRIYGRVVSQVAPPGWAISSAMGRRHHGMQATGTFPQSAPRCWAKQSSLHSGSTDDDPNSQGD
jgi:hypothetical protein